MIGFDQKKETDIIKDLYVASTHDTLMFFTNFGRVYWVKANVFPCFENGEIVGYISIRTKPEPDMIRKAIEAYRLVP